MDDFAYAGINRRSTEQEKMNAVDTNVLARFFINDKDDRESMRQRPAAIAHALGVSRMSVYRIMREGPE